MTEVLATVFPSELKTLSKQLQNVSSQYNDQQLIICDYACTKTSVLINNTCNAACTSVCGCFMSFSVFLFFNYVATSL